MALSAAVGTVTIATTDSSKAVSGLSFQPKAIILWTTNAQASSQKLQFSWGFGTSDGGTVQQRRHSIFGLDAASTSDYWTGQGGSDIIKTVTASTPTVDMILTLASLDATGFTLTVTDAPAASVDVYYLALGGTDLSAARCGGFACGTTTPQSVTINTGFGQPSLMLFSACHTGDAEAAASWAPSFGIASSSTSRQTASLFGTDAAGTMSLGGENKAAAMVKLASATTVDYDFDLDTVGNWPTDGFQITKTSAPAASRDVSYLALKGTFQSAIGTTAEPASDSTVTLSPGFAPIASFFTGINIADTSGSVVSSGNANLGGILFGATDGTTQLSASTSDLDGATTARSGSVVDGTHAVHGFVPSIGNANPAAAGAGSATFSGNTVPIAWTGTDAVLRLFPYFVLGSAAGGGTKTIAGTVNATSALSGAVVRIRLIGGTVNATSALSGNLAGIRQIAGSINVTSALSGGLQAIRAIAGTVNATSAFSGTVLHPRVLVAAAINATSALSGSVVAQRVISGSINATSALSGAIVGGAAAATRFVSNPYAVIKLLMRK